MDRRNFMMAAGLTAFAATLPMAPLKALAANPRITWGPDALDNPHAQLVANWIDEQIKAGILYTRDEILGGTVKLTDPRFKVMAGKAVWNWMTGYTDEDGLLISISERGVFLCDTSIATSAGYEKYWSKERDTTRFPDYFVRYPWIDDDHRRIIEARLPRGHVGIDTRMLDAMLKSKLAG